MENEKKVSVIIPCRNEVQYIERCIHSVCSFYQPPGGFEVIVIDGMSTDGTRRPSFSAEESNPRSCGDG